MRLGVDLTRLPTDDRLSAPVNVAEGTLCARSAPFAICADARMTSTDALILPDEPTSKVRSVYAGLLLGFTREGEAVIGPHDASAPEGHRDRTR